MRGGIKTVLIPKENEKDLIELPQVIKDNLKIIPVETADQVLAEALTQKVTPVVWDDKDEEVDNKKPAGQSITKAVEEDEEKSKDIIHQ